MARVSFSAAVKDWADAAEEKLKQVFHEAATEILEVANEEGPSKASTRAAIKEGLGSKGRGKNRREIQGPVRSGGSGNMPVDTGFLRNSLQVVLNGQIPLADRPNPDPKQKYPYTPSYEAVIAGAKLGDVISAGWTANYAVPIHYGTSKSHGYLFMEKALQQWPAIVDRAVARHRD